MTRPYRRHYVTDRDIARIKAMALSLTDDGRPPPPILDDLDAPIRVGVCRPGEEACTGAHIAVPWRGRIIPGLETRNPRPRAPTPARPLRLVGPIPPAPGKGEGDRGTRWRGLPPRRLQSQAPLMPDRRLEGPGSDQRLAAIRRRFRNALRPAEPSLATLAILAGAAFIITLAAGLWLTA